MSSERSGGSSVAHLALLALVMFLIFAAMPRRYERDRRRYLCWNIPSGQACVEVFHRGRP